MRLQARNTFFRAIVTVKDVMTATSKKEKVSVARTRRVVHSIIDLISRDDAALIELASIKDFDEYTYAHSTNVCIYSLTLGYRLGLNRRELSELGFAALFHDIGKVKLPNDLINKPDRYNEFDWAQMHKHPILGAMTIAKMLRLDTHMSRAMSVAYEHHIHPDHTGYPLLPEKRITGLYSRIVSIADAFDALISHRVYIKDRIPPDEVVRKMMHQMTVKFDALLLKQFINFIGIFPIGSLVLLSNKTVGVVSRTNSSELNRPELRIIADDRGSLEEHAWIDLAEAANRSIDIVRIIDPEKYNIDLTDIILSD
jgi:HD-GYP domain-containing protein (c-di-GMP phosphodiesterase class II)